MATVLSAHDLRGGYDHKEVLRGISLTLEVGEICAIIGPNGAGKSTLLKVIAGVLPAENGSVQLNGVDITRLAQADRARRGIAYLMQGGSVFPSLTVRENVAVAQWVSGVKSGAHRRGVVLELFPDLAPLLDRRAGLLSAGQRQLVALAMVAVNQHPQLLLLLDEPLGGVAPKVNEMILNGVRFLRDSCGASVLLVEQDLRAALGVSDRVCLIRAGMVAMERPSGAVQLHEIEEAFFA